MKACIVSVNVSPGRGGRKKPVGSAELEAGSGLSGDGHAGGWHRQVSLLALESIDKMRARGLDVGPGDFAENITTEGVYLTGLPVGARLRLGPAAVVEVTQRGKECHSPCEIYRQAGDCVMPAEGIFAVVVSGGRISEGDGIFVLGDSGTACEAQPGLGNRPGERSEERPRIQGEA